MVVAMFLDEVGQNHRVFQRHAGALGVGLKRRMRRIADERDIAVMPLTYWIAVSDGPASCKINQDHGLPGLGLCILDQQLDMVAVALVICCLQSSRHFHGDDDIDFASIAQRIVNDVEARASLQGDTFAGPRLSEQSCNAPHIPYREAECLDASALANEISGHLPPRWLRPRISLRPGSKFLHCRHTTNSTADDQNRWVITKDSQYRLRRPIRLDKLLGNRPLNLLVMSATFSRATVSP